MDIQRMFDSICAATREARKPYHLSLGALHDLCARYPEANVIVDGERGLGSEGSYRGYYEDISFQPTETPTPASGVLNACKRGLSNTYHGYKGGEYRYDRNTPTWLAFHGSCGPAIVSGEYRDGAIHLATRQVD